MAEAVSGVVLTAVMVASVAEEVLREEEAALMAVGSAKAAAG